MTDPHGSASKYTAIKRTRLSAPMRWLIENGYFVGEPKLDYGCGRGYDADELGIAGYDPHWRPVDITGKYEFISCNYVLNVVPAEEQQQIVNTVLDLLTPQGFAYFSVRRDLPKEGKQGRVYQHYVTLELDRIVDTSGFAIYRGQT